MSPRTLVIALVVVAVPLAGCVGSQSGGSAGPAESTDDAEADPPSEVEQPDEEQRPEQGWIFGTVAGEDGPIANALVELVEADRSYKTQAEGTFRFDNLAPGDYTVRYNHTHYNETTETVTVSAGEGANASASLGLRYLAPGVPSKYGTATVVYDADDTIVGAFGPPGAMTVRTEKTSQEAYWGYWKISPAEGFLLAYFEVNLSYSGEGLNAGGDLGIRYFWNEGGLFGPKPFQDCRSSIENGSLPSNDNCGYNYADLVAEGEDWKKYTVRNHFLKTWGDQQFQVGAYPSNGQDNPWGSQEFFGGADVPYHITITAYQLQETAVE